MIAFLAAVLPFAVVMSFTPGPNNLMLASAGARFGFARTLPHQAGVVTGFAAMMLCVGFGIAAVIAAVPALYRAMKIASILYILWLDWTVATADVAPSQGDERRPLGFFGAAAFQAINPKAWMTTLTAAATYTSTHGDVDLQVGLLAAVFAVVGSASSSTWALFGQVIRRYLTSPARRATFNRTMAGLLAASILPVVFER